MIEDTVTARRVGELTDRVERLELILRAVAAALVAALNVDNRP